MGKEIRRSVLLLTWLVFDVVLGATFGRYLAHVNFLIQDLHLKEGRHRAEPSLQTLPTYESHVSSLASAIVIHKKPLHRR